MKNEVKKMLQEHQKISNMIIYSFMGISIILILTIIFLIKYSSCEI